MMVGTGPSDKEELLARRWLGGGAPGHEPSDYRQPNRARTLAGGEHDEEERDSDDADKHQHSCKHDQRGHVGKATGPARNPARGPSLCLDLGIGPPAPTRPRGHAPSCWSSCWWARWDRRRRSSCTAPSAWVTSPFLTPT